MSNWVRRAIYERGYVLRAVAAMPTGQFRIDVSASTGVSSAAHIILVARATTDKSHSEPGFPTDSMSRSTASVFVFLTATLGVMLGDDVLWAATCRADDLDQVRHDVRESPPPDPPRPQKRRRHASSIEDCDDEPGFFSELAEAAILFTVGAPVWLPVMALEDGFVIAGFPDAPYANGHDGYLVIDDLSAVETDRWALRLSSEFGTDFDGMSRIGARLIAETSSRFGFDSEWNQWIEQTRAGNDSLSTGDFNLIYRFAQDEQVSFRGGVGFNWLADRDDADFGFNLTYGVDVYPSQPCVISATMDIGSLGDAFFFHVRSTAGIVWGRAELFTGVDYQRIGSVDLPGLLAGIRIWF